MKPKSHGARIVSPNPNSMMSRNVLPINPLRVILLCAVALFSAAAHAQVAPLPFRPVDARYSAALERIVAITSNPGQLHLYDPQTGNDAVINLGKPALAIDISPDGLHAAVGHDHLISYVDLNTRTVQATYPVTFAADVIALSNDELDAFNSTTATQGYIQDLHSATNTTYDQSLIVSGTALDTYARSLYYVSNSNLNFEGLLPISSNSPRLLPSGQNVIYSVGSPGAGKVWRSADHFRIYTSCPAVFGSGNKFVLGGQYVTTLPDRPYISALAEPPSSSAIAVIPSTATSPQCQAISQTDDHVLIYDTQYYRQTSRLSLAPFNAAGNSFVAHGRFVFYNSAGTKLYVIAQADPSASLGTDFQLQTFDLANPATCAISVSSANVGVSAYGGPGSVDISAPATCPYQVSSNASWVQIISAANASGNQTLRFIARPNPSSTFRTATITIGAQTVTVSQAAGLGFSPFMPLSFKVIAAAYSQLLDRAILVSSAPNELHIYDASTGADQIVPLPLAPLSLGLSPDGSHAVVGHAGWFSVVNLNVGAVERTIYVGMDVTAAALSNGRAVYFPGKTYEGVPEIFNYYVDAVNPDDLYPNALFPQSASILGFDPKGLALYSDTFLNRYINSPNALISLPASSCGNLWLADDDSQFTTACGEVFTLPLLSPDVPAYLGSLPDGSGRSSKRTVTWAADSSAIHTLAVIPYRGAQDPANQPDDTQVRLYNDVTRTLASQTALPQIFVGGQSLPVHGRYVFWNKAADKLIVFTQADAAASLATDWAVDVFSPAFNAATCAVTPATNAITLDAQGSTGNIAITAGDGCAWTAKSADPWLTISGGAFGVGSGTIGYSAGVNPDTTARNTQILVNSSTINVTQPGVAGVVIFAPATVTSPAAGGPSLVLVTALTPSFTWTITPGAPWITITSSLTNTGSAQVAYTVAPNTLGAPRSGTFYIEGQPFTVVQDGLPVNVTLSSTQLTSQNPTITATITATNSSLLWNPTSDASWLHFAVGNNSGSGTLNFGGGANYSGSPRTAHITIAGQPFTITQAVTIPTLTPASAQFGPNGGTGNVRLSDPTLLLQPVTSANWITITSSDQFSTLTYSVAPYNGVAPRSGTINIAGVVFNIVQSGSGPQGYNFVPITPCRAIDTRNGDGPAFNAFGGRKLYLTYHCNLPPTAVAYSLNVTAIPTTSKLDYFTVYPAGQPLPGVSTLNSYDGRVVANAAIVPAGQDGAINGYATDPMHLVIDVNGYFDATAPQGLSFYPLAPCRALDTRNANAPLGGPGLSNSSRDFPIQSSACQIPAAAQAYSMNVTAVPTGTLNYLTVWPTGQSQPLVSTLNSYDGSVVANAAISPAGTNGSVSAFASGSTDVLMDLNGIFAPPTTTGLKFYPLTPCRVVDTRNANSPLGGPFLTGNQIRPFPVAGTCGIPSTAQAYVLNATVVPKKNALHFLTLWPVGQNRPEASTLNSYQGKVLANAAIVPAGTNGDVNAFATEDTELILDVTGYFAP